MSKIPKFPGAASLDTHGGLTAPPEPQLLANVLGRFVTSKVTSCLTTTAPRKIGWLRHCMKMKYLGQISKFGS